jgi:hypothetical protein
MLYSLCSFEVTQTTSIYGLSLNVTHVIWTMWRKNVCINIVAGINIFRTKLHQQRQTSYTVTEIMEVGNILLLPVFVILLIPACLSVPLWDRASLVCAAIAGKQWVSNRIVLIESKIGNIKKYVITFFIYSTIN